MKQTYKRAGIGCLMVLSLAACGGGGGGGAAAPGPGVANVQALDASRARTYFPGSEAAGLTAGQAREEIRRRFGNIQGGASGALLLSDISLFTTRDDVSLPVRVDTTCSGATCSTILLGVTIPFSVGDLSVTSQPLSPVMRYREIPLAAYGGNDADGTEVFGYGGWLDYSVFAVDGAKITADENALRDVSLYGGYSTGIRSNSRPTGGGARWDGVMVATGVDLKLTLRSLRK